MYVEHFSLMSYHIFGMWYQKCWRSSFCPVSVRWSGLLQRRVSFSKSTHWTWLDCVCQSDWSLLKNSQKFSIPFGRKVATSIRCNISWTCWMLRSRVPAGQKSITKPWRRYWKMKTATQFTRLDTNFTNFFKKWRNPRTSAILREVSFFEKFIVWPSGFQDAFRATNGLGPIWSWKIFPCMTSSFLAPRKGRIGSWGGGGHTRALGDRWVAKHIPWWCRDW